jgi:hypothetical protein
MSKLIHYPAFRPVPKSNMADVQENLERVFHSNSDKDKELLVFCNSGPGSYMGYRFVRAEDLTQTIRTEQWFKRSKDNVCLEFYFTRFYHTTDHFCPLYFSEWYTTVIIKHKHTNIVDMYHSDAQLKRFIKQLPAT